MGFSRLSLVLCGGDRLSLCDEKLDKQEEAEQGDL